MREETRSRSCHHPVTPRTGFFPGSPRTEGFRVGKTRRGSAGRRVGFKEEVVVHVLVHEEEERDGEKEEGDLEMKDSET